MGNNSTGGLHISLKSCPLAWCFKTSVCLKRGPFRVVFCANCKREAVIMLGERGERKCPAKVADMCEFRPWHSRNYWSPVLVEVMNHTTEWLPGISTLHPKHVLHLQSNAPCCCSQECMVPSVVSLWLLLDISEDIWLFAGEVQKAFSSGDFLMS